MPQDSVSYNTKLTPPDTISFFKGFVMAQDEVPGKLQYHQHGISPVQLLKNEGGRIIQSQVENNSQFRISIFTPHQLHIKDRDALPKAELHNEWIFGVIVICLLLSAFVRILHFNRLNQIFKAFLKPNFINQLMRDGNIINERITPPLILLQFLSFSLFIYQAINLLIGIPALPFADYFVFILVFAVVSGFYGLKIFLVKTIGWVFQTKEQANMYVINSMVINEICGIVLLPFSLMMYYTVPGIALIMAWTAVFLFIISFIYILVRGFMIGMTVRNFSGLFLILYLCTVEFLPVLILGRLATDHFFLT
jgi:hypothetical protein